VVPATGDPRAMTPKPRRKSAKHRELSESRREAVEGGWLPEWYAAREAEKRAAESVHVRAQTCAQPPARPAYPTPPPQNPFDAAYTGHPITLEAVRWNDRGIAEWLLPTCQMGSNQRPQPQSH
jgi:hypothetical protein